MEKKIELVLCSCAAQGCGVASLAEGVAVPLMHWPRLVRARIWNVVMVLMIAHILLAKDTVGYLSPPTNAGRRDTRLTVHTLMNHPACETLVGQF